MNGPLPPKSIHFPNCAPPQPVGVPPEMQGYATAMRYQPQPSEAPRYGRGAPDDHGATESPGKPIAIARGSKGGDFLAAYEPISYTIEGILPSGYIYGVTARRGDGKTAFLITTALAVVTGDARLLGCEVQQGRVAYIVKENPDDFRMKLAVNCFFRTVTSDLLNERLFILDGRTDTPEAIVAALNASAAEQGPFQLVCYDTFQAGFAGTGGAEFNSNAEVLNFMLRLRPITQISGKPSVLVAFHPTKNAGEDDLVPYGGGAIMNELDGNLTLWAAEQIKLSWNKVRGPEFQARYFQIERLSSPEIVDIKGRQILLPAMSPTSALSVEEKQTAEVSLDRLLLRAMFARPEARQEDWAGTIGRSKGSVNKRLQRLKSEKLVTVTLGKWRLTPKGSLEAARS